MSEAASPFVVLLQLEAEIRRAESLKSLQFLIANDTRRIASYRQAYVLEARRSSYRVAAISSLAVVDRNAPAVRWTEAIVNVLVDGFTQQAVQFINAMDCPEELRNDWPNFSFSHAALCALVTPTGQYLGALWISRDQPFTESDRTVLSRLGETYGHAWGALAGWRAKRRGPSGARIGFALLLLAVALMFVPIRMTALAPSEIVATEPMVVAAPLDGVIKQVLVPPNTRVESGEHLFNYEAVDLHNEYEIAERRLDVARAVFRKAESSAFQDPESRARLAQLEAEVDLLAIERDYARERLDRVSVTAERSGLLLYSDPSDWEGRPVKVGERVMEIVSPDKAHTRINLPVADAIVIEPGAGVEVFLDIDPLEPRQAALTSASYVAEKTAEGALAFPVEAEFTGGQKLPRIGLKGTAKVYGQRTTLFYYLFRRPISAARQYFGF